MMTFTQAQTAGGRRRPEPGPGERHRDAGGVPVGADAGPPLSARSDASRLRSEQVTRRRPAAVDRHRRARPTTDASAPPRSGRSSVLGSWWVIAGFAALLLLVLGWKFLADPSLSAPTRDPAWYTWRAQVIAGVDPVRVAQEWGPDGLFAGGYRVTVPLAGALLQQVVGIDRYSFSAFLMIGIPILTGPRAGRRAASAAVATRSWCSPPCSRRSRCSSPRRTSATSTTSRCCSCWR